MKEEKIRKSHKRVKIRGAVASWLGNNTQISEFYSTVLRTHA